MNEETPTKSIPEDMGYLEDTFNNELLTPPPEDVSDIPGEVLDDVAYEHMEAGSLQRGKKYCRVRYLFFLMVLLLAVLLLCRELYKIIQGAFGFNTIYGAAITILVCFIGLLLFLVVDREVKTYFRLASFDKLREDFEELANNPLNITLNEKVRNHFHGFLKYLDSNGDGELSENIRSLRKRMDLTEDANEWRQFACCILLKPLDEKAGQIIRKEARNVTIGTALSPRGFLDATISIWRNVVLIRRIASIYCVRPGFYGTLRLAKRSIISAASAVVAQNLATMIVTTFKGLLLRVVSPLSQGVTNGMMTIYVGLEAQKLCRPIKFAKEEEQGVLKTALKAVKDAAKTIKKNEPEEDA